MIGAGGAEAHCPVRVGLGTAPNKKAVEPWYTNRGGTCQGNRIP